MKRKYKIIGELHSIDSIRDDTFYMVKYGERWKTVHGSFLLSQQIRNVRKLIRERRVCFAERLTNREYYGELTASQITKKFGEETLQKRMDGYSPVWDESPEDYAVWHWLEDYVE